MKRVTVLYECRSETVWEQVQQRHQLQKLLREISEHVKIARHEVVTLRPRGRR